MIEGNTRLYTYTGSGTSYTHTLYELRDGVFVKTQEKGALAPDLATNPPSTVWFKKDDISLIVINRSAGRSAYVGYRTQIMDSNLNQTSIQNTYMSGSNGKLNWLVLHAYDRHRNQIAIPNLSARTAQGSLRVDGSTLYLGCQGVNPVTGAVATYSDCAVYPYATAEDNGRVSDAKEMMKFSPNGKYVAWIINNINGRFLVVSYLTNDKDLWTVATTGSYTGIRFIGADMVPDVNGTTIPIPDSGVEIIEWSPDSRILVSASVNKSQPTNIYRFSTDGSLKWVKVAEFPDLGENIAAVKASPDNVWWVVSMKKQDDTYTTVFYERIGNEMREKLRADSFGKLMSFNADGSYIFDAFFSKAFKLEDGAWVEDKDIMSAVPQGALSMAVSDHVELPPSVGYIYDDLVNEVIVNKNLMNTLKIALINDSAPAFDSSHTTLDQAVGSGEAFGSGWPQGGVALVNSRFVRSGTNAVSLISEAVISDITDGWLTFRAAVIYDSNSANKTPMIYYDFGKVISAEVNTTLTITFGADGFLIFTP